MRNRCADVKRSAASGFSAHVKNGAQHGRDQGAGDDADDERHAERGEDDRQQNRRQLDVNMDEPVSPRELNGDQGRQQGRGQANSSGADRCRDVGEQWSGGPHKKG